jgi:hypothetical protein
VRDVPAIWEAWRSGAQVGDTRPCTRVTVEPGWWLNRTSATVGTWTRGPARWYQPFDRSTQDEVELTNVVSVSHSRGVESDAGNCDITLTNNVGVTPGTPELIAGQLGDPGYYTFDHGVAQDAQARWNAGVNNWLGVLTPNALVRTYQGFGGHDKSLADAQADGNIVLNGVWLVDDVNITSDGTISLKCRDMMKLVLDQQLYPPLVPANLYPLRYERWHTVSRAIPTNLPPPPEVCYQGQYFNSSTDVYYGQWNTRATGHPGVDAFDMSTEAQLPFNHQMTFWKSEPFADRNGAPWIDFLVDGFASRHINEIYFHPCGGPQMGWPQGMYLVMASVWEKGAWARPEVPGGGITPQGIPYVTTFVPGVGGPGLPDNSNLFRLPRTYNTSVIRLTMTNLLPATEPGWGPDARPGDRSFRAGARKIMTCWHYHEGEPNFNNIVFAGASMPVNSNGTSGYWQARATGQVYAFGDARTQPVTSPQNAIVEVLTGLAPHPSGHGYWALDAGGRVLSYGDAQWFGDVENQNISVIDIAATYDGGGYWLLAPNGQVFPFGNAQNFGDSSHGAATGWTAQSIERHPTQQGYWVLWQDGTITAHNTTHYGDASRVPLLPLEWFTSIHCTESGAGYWVLSGTGRMFCFGDAPDRGSATAAAPVNTIWFMYLTWDFIPSCLPGNAGYQIQHANGTLEGKGNYDLFGSIGSGSQIERSPGNYKDYSDIVKDLLLWSGFYLYRDPQPGDKPPDVFGNIESTGAWASDPLPADMFDKRSVYDAIKDLRDIVGYIFYIDQEGGAHFESPSWWQLGNYTAEGKPFGQMPEIDEKVNLLTHAIQYSGGAAFSEIIIATEDPFPRDPGKPTPTGIVQTRITPKTIDDLRGMLHLYMRTNLKLSDAKEQKVMADLIDMKMWFSRRLGQLTCTANPLIDLNDQVRVIERYTGEVYVHYIRSIQTQHDLTSGEFTMDITTHWLGGGPWYKWTTFYAGVARPQGDGYWTITLGGTFGNNYRSGLYPFGGAHTYTKHENDSHTQDINCLRSTASGNGLWSMDRTGKVITWGDAVNYGDLDVAATDERPNDVYGLAPTPTGQGYWILTGDGTVHCFGDAQHFGNAQAPAFVGTTTNPGFVTDIESHPTQPGYWIVDCNGRVQAFNLADHGSSDRTDLTATEWYVAIRRTADGDGYWLLAGSGHVRAKGNAPFYGNASTWTGNWWFGIVWDLIANPDNSYILLRSDGSLEAFGAAALYTPVPRETKYSALATAHHVAAMQDPSGVFPVSTDVVEFLGKTGSKAAANAIASQFGADPDAATHTP